MVEKTKTHFAWNEVKISIIELILDSDGPINEPSIREQLLTKYGSADQGLINRHLHDLKKLNCIELVPYAKKSRSNFWDIKTQDNLKEIRSNFEKIDLNQKEKALLIILKKMNYGLESHLGLQIYIRMLLSPSFFNMCIDIGFETMQHRYVTMYQYGDGFVAYNIIDNRLRELYDEIKEYQFYETDEITFRRTMEKISCQCKGKSRNVIRKTLEEKFKELSERLHELMIHTIELIRYYNDLLNMHCIGLLLEHCFKQDILMAVACLNEMTMMYYIKTNYNKYPSNESENATNELVMENLKIASEVIIRYKQPSIFFEISANSNEIYEILKDYYRGALSEPPV